MEFVNKVEEEFKMRMSRFNLKKENSNPSLRDVSMINDKVEPITLGLMPEKFKLLPEVKKGYNY